jgi:hypothetical protein
VGARKGAGRALYCNIALQMIFVEIGVEEKEKCRSKIMVKSPLYGQKSIFSRF